MKINENTANKGDLNVLRQVLNTFLGIDKKILDLHKCSSDDFLSLNKAMKQNHQKAGYIISHVAEAFEKVGNEGNIKHIGDLKQFFITLQTEIETFQLEINHSLDILERLQSNFSLMFVPINNFRQNLASLRLLLSNIKLTNNLYDRSMKNFTEIESTRIESVITKVKESCPIFEENIYVIQKHLKGQYQEMVKLKSKLFDNVLSTMDLLVKDIEIIEKHSFQAYPQKEVTEKIAQNSKSSVGSIITNLQYHDIIRQKMEHIQMTHKLIIDKINTENEENGSLKEYNPANPFFLQIPQIIEIQTAQLLHTNKEYQNAIDHISKKMIEIGRDMTTIARLYQTLSVFEYKGRNVSPEQLTTFFDNLISESLKCVNTFEEQAEEVSLVKKIVNDLFDKFRDLEMIENSIEQSIIDKISFGNLLVSEEKETASQAQQILKLYADNHFEKNKIRTLFENSLSQLREYVGSNTIYLKEKKSKDRIQQQITNARQSFDKIISNLNYLENLRTDIVAHGDDINNASKDVVANVKYYDFFERTIDELVDSFESINQLLKVHGEESFTADDRKKGLEQIEKYYTMKSERIIHDNALLNTSNPDELANYLELTQATDYNNEGNDVEFF